MDPAIKIPPAKNLEMQSSVRIDNGPEPLREFRVEGKLGSIDEQISAVHKYPNHEHSLSIERDGTFRVTNRFPKAEHAAAMESFEKAVLDPDCIKGLTVSELRAIRTKIENNEFMTREELDLLGRTTKVYREELSPVLVAQKIGLSGKIAGRSPAGLGDIAIDQFRNDEPAYFEVKILPHFSKFFDVQDAVKHRRYLEHFADKLKRDPRAVALFVPLDSISPEKMIFLRHELEALGISKDRILCVHSRLLDLAGGGFREIFERDHWRLAPRQFDRDQHSLFSAAATAVYLNDMAAITADSRAALTKNGFGSLMRELIFYRGWPESELGLKKADALANGSSNN